MDSTLINNALFSKKCLIKNTHHRAMSAFLSGSYVVFMYNALNKIFNLLPLT
jgi:hypothetical protein